MECRKLLSIKKKAFQSILSVNNNFINMNRDEKMAYYIIILSIRTGNANIIEIIIMFIHQVYMFTHTMGNFVHCI